MRVTAITPSNDMSGEDEVKKWYGIAESLKSDFMILPNSFLPYYGGGVTASCTQQIKDLMPTWIDGKCRVVSGMSEIDIPSGKKYQSIVIFSNKEVEFIQRQTMFQSHIEEIGYTPGTKREFYDWNGYKINLLGCFDCLHPHLWRECDIHFVCIGFGMKAKTPYHDCDYFNQWLNVLRAMCSLNNTFCVSACNGQHRDFMTSAINRSGEIIGLARHRGMFSIDIDLDELDEKKRLK